MSDLLKNIIEDPCIQNLQHRHYTSVHIAVLVLRGKIIAQAHNKIGSRSRGSGYSSYSIHAEKNVLKNLGDYEKMRGADMYVFRIGRGTNSHMAMNSKPCYACELFLNKCIRKYGLKNIYYTQGNDNLGQKCL